MVKKFAFAALAIALAGPAVAQTQGIFGGYPLAASPLTGNETFPADTELTGGQTPQTERIGMNAIGAFGRTVTAGFRNFLIGGDATTNLFQRATTGASVTTTVTYGGPDRWAYWSGTATAMTVSRSSTAADLPASSFQYGFKMARTSGQTGVLPLCMAQVIESSSAIALAGTTAELDFYADTGANFSAANGNLSVYIITGTGSDEGMQKLAWGLNAGGGGSTAWTGQANAIGTVVAISSTNTRYAAVANIPAAATEIAVAFCYTPVGTAGTNDYVTLAGLQLSRNITITPLAGTIVNASTAQLSATERRPPGLEALLQYRYFYKVAETAAIFPFAPCAAVDTTHTNCFVAFPAVMRIAPTMTYTAGFASPTTTSQATLGACTALASAATVTSTVAATTGVLVNCTATTIPAAGIASFLYSNNGAGVINASAEL